MYHRVGKSVFPLRGSCLFTLSLCLAVGVCASSALGDANVADTQLAQAWNAFYAGKYPEAQKLAAPLRKSPKEAHRVEAAYIQARILWAGGEKTQPKAQKAWAVLKRASSLNSLQERMKISQALQMSALNDESKDRQAIAILEGVLQRGYPDTCTTEAAIELARLYVKVKNFAKAKQALDFGIAHLNSQKVTAELPPALAEPFLNEAKAALKRLDYEEDPCRMSFEQAEKLRAEKKFIPAYKAYRQILKEYGQTVYGPLCELHIGHCLLGLNKFDRAVKHWSQFVQSSPSGPWRGQAYLELIDLYLEKKFDIDAAVKYGQLASGAMPAALKDTYAAPSWQEVALLIHLRLGVIACMQGQLPVAVNEFDQALQSPGMNDSVSQGLKRLIDVLKSGKPLLPEDVAFTVSPGNLPSDQKGSSTSLDKHSAVLGAVMVYDLTGRTGEAETMLARILPSNLTAKDRASIKPFPGSLPSQLAFAAYLRGKILSEQNRFAEALKLLQASLKGYRQANWHDATLYLLATTIERQAQTEFDQKLQAVTAKAQQDITKKWKKQLALDAAKKAEQDKLTGKLPEKVKANNIISEPAIEVEFCEWNLTPDLRSEYRRALRTAEDNGRKAYTKSCATALPYWQQLTKYFPKSPYAEVALYNQAVLLYEAEKFEDASKVLDHLVKTYPASPFAGDACVKLADIALERMFSLPVARIAITAGLQWAESAKAAIEKTEAAPKPQPTSQPAQAAGQTTPQSIKLALPSLAGFSVWAPTFEVPSDDIFRCTIYDCYLRAGLVAYLSQSYSLAEQCFQFAQPFMPQRDFVVVMGNIPTGIERILEAVREKKHLTPYAVLEGGSEKTKLTLQLMDIFSEAGQYNKAIELCGMVIATRSSDCTDLQKSWAYFSRARSTYEIPQCMEAREDYIAAQKACPKAPWAAQALFYAGTITHNSYEDCPGSIVFYKRVAEEYPDSEFADKAAYFIGVSYEDQGQFAKAKKAYQLFLKNYPESRWVRVVKNEHLKRIEQAMTARKHRKKKGT